MFKRIVVSAVFLFVLGARTSAQSQEVSMPDYSAWEVTADHTESYTYRGLEIQLPPKGSDK